MMSTDLLNDKELREMVADRIEVLDKVKKLVLLDGADFMTTDQVAEYYEVYPKTVSRILDSHREELESDGFVLLKKKDLRDNSLNPQKVELNKKVVDLKEEKFKTTITDRHGNQIVVPNRGLNVFPKRAILRVGMLLRDSRIAVEVRNQLLNVIENTDEKTVVKEMDEEKSLALEITEAMLRNDTAAMMTAFAEFNEYKNRHIKNLEDTNKSLKADNHALADGIFTWDNRKQLNALIRNLAKMSNTDYHVIWNLLYRDLGYKFDIYPKLRNNGRKPYLDNLYEEEYPIAIRVFAAICEMYGFTFDQVATNCGFGINKAKGA